MGELQMRLQSAMTQIFTSDRQQKQWLSEATLQVICQKHEARERHLRRPRDDYLKAQYQTARRRAHHMCNADRRQWRARQVHELRQATFTRNIGSFQKLLKDMDP